MEKDLTRVSVNNENMPIIFFGKQKDKEIPDETVNLVEFAPMVNMKAKGKKLTSYKVKEINLRVPEEIVMEDFDEEDENIGGFGHFISSQKLSDESPPPKIALNKQISTFTLCSGEEIKSGK